MKSVLLTRVLSLFTYFSPITLVFLIVFCAYYVLFKSRRRRLEQLMAKIPGPTALPIIGNTLEINVGYDGNLERKMFAFFYAILLMNEVRDFVNAFVCSKLRYNKRKILKLIEKHIFDSELTVRSLLVRLNGKLYAKLDKKQYS